MFFKGKDVTSSCAPLDESDGLNTNDVSLWSLDAIYMQEVIPYTW